MVPLINRRVRVCFNEKAGELVGDGGEGVWLKLANFSG
jgi:hypothetical protein